MAQTSVSIGLVERRSLTLASFVAEPADGARPSASARWVSTVVGQEAGLVAGTVSRSVGSVGSVHSVAMVVPARI